MRFVTLLLGLPFVAIGIHLCEPAWAQSNQTALATSFPADPSDEAATKHYVDNSQVLSVLQFGAAGDGRSAALNMKAGSNVAEATPGPYQATFSKADVGKTIDVVGIGSIVNQAIPATVMAVDSAREIRLSVIAVRNVIGAQSYLGTENTAAFNHAISAACSAQSTIYIPAGNYYLGPLESLPAGCTTVSNLKGIHFQGSGMFSAVLVERLSATSDLLNIAHVAGPPITIHDLGFQRSYGYGPTVPGTSQIALLRLTKDCSVYIDRVWFEGSPTGLEIDDSCDILVHQVQTEFNDQGIVINNALGPVIVSDSGTFVSARRGIYVENSNIATFGQTSMVTLDNDYDYASPTGLEVIDSKNVQISNFSEQAGTQNKIGIYLAGSSKVQIVAPNIEGSQQAGIRIDRTGPVSITAPVITGIGRVAVPTAGAFGIYVAAGGGSGNIVLSQAFLDDIAGDCIYSVAGMTISDSSIRNCNQANLSAAGLDATYFSSGNISIQNSRFSNAVRSGNAVNITGTGDLTLLNNIFDPFYTSVVENSSSGTVEACLNHGYVGPCPNTQYAGALTLGSGPSDVLAVAGLPAGSHCSAQPTDSAGASATAVYIPATVSAGTVVVNHTGGAGGNLSIFCSSK